MNKQLKPFDKVLVRQDNNTYWGCDLYSHPTDDLSMHCCAGGLYSQCIPYEGNEHLLGTTDAPQPKRWRAEKGDVYYCVNTCMEVICDTDDYVETDDDCYSAGNYFQTREEAQVMADRLRATLKGG